jgi:tetratricopeptide (TPR) repeat protein
MRRSIFGGATSLLLFLSAPGQGASPDDDAGCAQHDDLDRRIASCTRVLNDVNKNAHDRAVAFSNRGLAWHDKRKRMRALADYSEAVGLNPKLANAYYGRGVVWSKEDEVERALADFTEAIRLEPNNAIYYNERCWALAVADRDLELALADCTEALRREPNDANMLDSRGFVYLRLGRLAEAVAEYDAALKINPDEAQSLFGRGIAKAAQRRQDRRRRRPRHGKGDQAPHCRKILSLWGFFTPYHDHGIRTLEDWGKPREKTTCLTPPSRRRP